MRFSHSGLWVSNVRDLAVRLTTNFAATLDCALLVQ